MLLTDALCWLIAQAVAFTWKIETGRLKEIKKLAIDLERPVNTLLEEAIDYLVAKYKPKARPAK